MGRVVAAAKPLTRRVNYGSGHGYLIDGDKVTSITKVLRVIAKPLVGWAAGEAADYALDHWDELLDMKPSDRRDAIRKAPDLYRDERAALGKVVHKLIEALIVHNEVDVPEGYEGYVDAWQRFDDEWQPEAIRVEVPVYHRTAGYGGTPDLVARLVDGRTWLLDWKTALKGLYPEIALQLAAARFAEFYLDAEGREVPVPPVDAAGGVEIRGDGTYDLRPIEADVEAFHTFLNAKRVAAFTEQPRERWIGDALTR